MRPKVRSFRTQRGFTLIEILISIAIMSILSVGFVTFMFNSQRQVANIESKSSGTTQLDGLLKEVKTEFFKRMIADAGDPAPFEMVAGQPGQLVGCGGLLIRQRRPVSGNTKNIRRVMYYSICAPGPELAPPAGYMTGVTVTCPAQQRLTVMRQTWDTTAAVTATETRLLPAVTDPRLALTLCFTQLVDGVRVQGGALVRIEPNITTVQKSIGMPFADKSSLVEILPLAEASP